MNNREAVEMYRQMCEDHEAANPLYRTGKRDPGFVEKILAGALEKVRDWTGPTRWRT